MKQCWFLLGLCLGLSLILPVAAQQPQIPPTIDQPQTAGTWSDEFASYDRSDLNDYPRRPMEWNNTLYSGMHNHGVAAWNGRQWLQIGNLEGRAIAITWHQNKLYAYGKLTLAGTPVSLAYWDGVTWTAMPNQISYHTSVTLASYNNQLYLASGHAFTIDGQEMANLARWDGAQWHAADAGLQGMITTMLVRPEGLYVGGSFALNANQWHGLLCWDGNQWQMVGSPLSGLVLDLEWANDQLYVGGLFTSTLDPAINNIAAWNGSSWDSFGNGIGDGRRRDVHSIAFLDDELYVMSRVDTALGYHQLQRWNGTTWVILANTTGANGGIDWLWYPDVVLLNYQEQLFAFGLISFVHDHDNSDQYSIGLMSLAWNGTHWESMTPNGLIVRNSNRPQKLLATSDEIVYTAANNLNWGNGQAALAQFAAGQTWQALLPPYRLTNSIVYEAEAYRATLFLNIDNALFKLISGTIELQSTSQVHSMAQANNLLYVAGNFEQFNGVTAHNLVTWNGSQWQALNAPASFERVTIVEAYGSQIYISDGAQVARWDGAQWQSLVTEVNSITQIEPTASGVYVAGTFSTINGVAAQKIAYWNGSAWSALTGVINGPINDLELGTDGLYVAGSFSGITNGVVSPGILRWNGVWNSVGGGVQYRYTPQLPISVTSLASTPTRMYAIGTFDTVGNRYESSLIAAWQYGTPALINAAPDYATTYRPQPVNIAVLANDWTIDNEIVEFVAVTSASHGTATISGTQILYTPNNDFQGTESLSYTLRNPVRGITTTGSLTIDVLNHFPTLVPLTHTVQPNSTTTFDVLAELVDLNGDELSITQASATLGTVSIEQHQLRYVAPTQGMITATISYSVSDGHGATQTSTVSVTSTAQQVYLPFVTR